MPDHARNREWLEEEVQESSAPGLPRPDLNPLVNPLLAQNMGRWAEVYFTSPADQREHAVEKLVQELQAGTGSKKPAISQSAGITDRAALSPIPSSRAESKLPELPMQGSNDKRKPTISDDVDEDLMVCPGCLHKNAAEQRFCGICGTALTQEAPDTQAEAAAQPPAPGSRQAENPESDWGWLREKTLSSYDVGTEKKSSSQMLLVLLVLLVIAVGGYFLWQNHARTSREQAPSSTASPPQSSSGPSLDLPIASPASPSTVQPAPKTKAETNASPKVAPPAQGQSNNSSTQSSGVVPSDDGGDEFNQGRRYLTGEGVPRNSWMASQFLWKAIAKQNSDAVLLLSDLYARGDGVPRSCEQARILLVSAAKKGSSAAAQKLRSIETSCR